MSSVKDGRVSEALQNCREIGRLCPPGHAIDERSHLLQIVEAFGTARRLTFSVWKQKPHSRLHLRVKW